MSRSAYFSIPVSIDWDTALDAMKAVTEDNGIKESKFWERDKVYELKNLKADDFILVLPNFAWSSKLSDLPAGCARELKLAISLGRKIYILYAKRTTGYYGIYETDIDKTSITSLSGTCNSISHFYSDEEDDEYGLDDGYEDEFEYDRFQSIEHSSSDYDSRLLLG